MASSSLHTVSERSQFQLLSSISNRLVFSPRIEKNVLSVFLCSFPSSIRFQTRRGCKLQYSFNRRIDSDLCSGSNSRKTTSMPILSAPQATYSSYPTSIVLWPPMPLRRDCRQRVFHPLQETVKNIEGSSPSTLLLGGRRIVALQPKLVHPMNERICEVVRRRVFEES